MNKTIYVSNRELWEESKAHAKVLGITHSKLIERALLRYMKDISRSDAIKIAKLRALLDKQGE